MLLSRGRIAILALLVPLLGVSGSSIAQAQPSSAVWMPQIAIVWPQDGKGHQTGVAQSRAVNVSVWPTNQVGCAKAPNPPVGLYLARNNDPGDYITQSQLIQRMVGSVTFPSAEFNDLPANLATNRGGKYSVASGAFFYTNRWSDASNVWVDGTDPRTDYPQPVVPTGVATGRLSEIDLRIQVVWPHDAEGRYAPPDRATFVNVAMDIFQHGTTLSVPVDYPRPEDDAFGPYLEFAEDNQPVHDPIATINRLGASADVADATLLHPQAVSYTADGQTLRHWVFNDVPVQPGHQYHFLALMGSTRVAPTMHPTIWTHAADARTLLPAPQPPPSCVP